MKDNVLILSGGMDSVTMLYEYRDAIALAVSFNYGANHNQKEIAWAKLHCERLHIQHMVIDLAFMKQYFKSSLLEGGDKIPDGNYNEQNMLSTVVPFRNGIMLSVAAGLAESKHLKKIMMANHFGDHTIYPDCRKSFVDAFNAAVGEGTCDHIELVAPYTGITKTDISRKGKMLGIDYAETWSCYKGGDIHCGVCGTCCERKEALKLAGIVDTTRYEQD